MNKEARLIVRLIALWVIFIASLGFAAYAGGRFVTASVQVINKGYEPGYSYVSYDSSSCLQMPNTPTLSDMQTGQTAEDKALTAKYNQDLEKYNSEYRALCEADRQKEEEAGKEEKAGHVNQQRSVAIGDMAAYFILSVLGVAAMHMSFKKIKASEKA